MARQAGRLGGPRFTWPFRARRLAQDVLSWIYPDTNPVCVLCHRPMLSLEDEELVDPLWGWMAGILHSSEQTPEPNLWRSVDGSLASSAAHPTLSGVCLFCLQMLRSIPVRVWRGQLRVPMLTAGGRLPKDVEMPPYGGSDGPMDGRVDGRLRKQIPEARIMVACGTPYRGELPALIRAWKYDGVLALTPWYAEFVMAALARISGGPLDVAPSQNPGSLRDVAPGLGHSGEPQAPTTRLSGDWLVVPVPTTRERVRKRGYDHVRLLAEAVAAQLGIPCWPGLERRSQREAVAGSPAMGRMSGHREGRGTGSVYTQSQTAKSAAERQEGLTGQFTVNPAALDAIPRLFARVPSNTIPASIESPAKGRPLTPGLTGYRVLLVDDIVTTGSTMSACAATLLQAGAARVAGTAIARVE
jgi:hypothetical protein